MEAFHINGERLWQSLMEMARIGATPRGGVCRVALTDVDRQGREVFIRWAREAGCEVEIDQMGSIFAHRPGTENALPPVLTGSHLDTQPTGGKFDGVYGVLAGLEVLYTPQLVLHGRALSTWGALAAEVQRINHTPARAELSLEVTTQAANTLEVSAQALVPEAAARPHTQMYLALYENRLTSMVTAGENAGHTLRHDYVVRQWFGPLAIDTQGTSRLQQTLSLQHDWKTSDLGLVVFVQQHQTGDVLQTLALPLGH
jgi:hypothetical protein